MPKRFSAGLFGFSCLFASVPAAAQLLGTQLFPSDNPWNQSIANAPVSSASAAVMNNILTRYGDGRFHPDFSQDFQNAGDLYGIPFNVVHGNSTPKISVVLGIYAGQSDPQPCPIPAGAVLEGDFQNGPRFGLAARGDSHLLVWDIDTNILYEFYNASRPNENGDGQWHAAGQAVWDLNANTFRPRGWTSADAAGLPILTGLARPDEGVQASRTYVFQSGRGLLVQQAQSSHSFRAVSTVTIHRFVDLLLAQVSARMGGTQPQKLVCFVLDEPSGSNSLCSLLSRSAFESSTIAVVEARRSDNYLRRPYEGRKLACSSG